MTSIIYTIIIFSSSLFAFFSQSRIRTEGHIVYRKNNLQLFLISFLILSFFSCFSGVGIDRKTYAFMFLNYSKERLFNEVEPGFAILNLFLRLFIKDYRIYLFIIAFMTLVFVYYGIWKLKDKLPVGFSIFIFSSQFYLQSFNLMRMYFAISITICFAYLIFQKKYTQYFFVLIIAALFHYSIIFAIIAYIIGLFINLQKISFQNTYFLLFFIASLLIYRYIQLIIVSLVSLSSTMSKYSRYMNFEIGALGTKWIINLVPFILLIIYSKYNSEKKIMKSLGISYLFVALLISFLSYTITIIGRGLMTLNLISIILLPICIESYKRYKIINKTTKMYLNIFHKKFILKNIILELLLSIYCVLSYYLYLKEYLKIDGINIYRFIWNVDYRF